MFQFAETPNLRHLRFVQVIGRVGGVSGAARELCTSQPAVTQAVSNIEAEIGTPIFERSATGTYPTPLGRQYLLRLDRFFEILDAVLTQVVGKQAQADRLITGTQLRALIVITEPGRVNEIAESLAMSPASLQRAARTLERSLGRPLFDRTAHGPIPNKTGTLLAREFRRAVREIELARGEVLLDAGAESLEVVVGAVPMAGSFELAEATRQFMARHPAVKLRLVTGDYHHLLEELLNSRIDMFFGLLRRPDWASEVSEDELYRDGYCMVARPEHPLCRLDEVTSVELARYQWVVPSVGTPRRKRIEAIFKGLKAHPSFHIETSSLSMSRAMLLGSDTITLMTRSEVQHDLKLGILCQLHCPWLSDMLPKGVTTRSDWLPTQAHTDFVECLRESTGGSQPGSRAAA
ncbi:LysR family transcriptional regulator [Pelomonas sp. KK5]|uniref:LysR family transcriptional regulator n=1 Tax=Pelomonas sp. KK5 TaxID=1855730 RepID=UPI00097C2ABD|nr:LysR family transcriptional regulator [Pelomonas sp. KK5]